MFSFDRGRLLLPGHVVGGTESGAVASAFSRLTRLEKLAHHPSCGYWANHLVRIGNCAFCLGCLFLTLGCLVALPFAAWIAFNGYDGLPLFCIGVLSYGPTYVQIWVQNYWFKVVSRSSLGVSLASHATGALAVRNLEPSEITWSLAFLVSGAILFWTSWVLRRSRLDNPCVGCPSGTFPFCEWKRSTLDAIIADSACGKRTLPPNVLSALESLRDKIPPDPKGLR